jgi:transcription termination factor NusB
VNARARNVRVTRRYALMALYQFDSGLAGDLESVRGALENVEELGDDGEGPDLSDASARVEARDPERLAERAKPIIDRNALRLGWYGFTHGGDSVAIAIDECVELAKTFSTEKSGAFVNAVLDRVAKSAGSGQGA